MVPLGSAISVQRGERQAPSEFPCLLRQSQLWIGLVADDVDGVSSNLYVIAMLRSQALPNGTVTSVMFHRISAPS
jgi:hypothetical protein